MKISLRNLTKSFGSQRVLDDISFEAEFPHTLALIGPSGGGKSTLLRILAGLEIPESGTVEIDGEKLRFDSSSLRTHRRKLGVVFQAYNLFPHLTALENVLLPLEKVHRVTNARERAMTSLARFRLDAHAGKRPAELSGWPAPTRRDCPRAGRGAGDIVDG